MPSYYAPVMPICCVETSTHHFFGSDAKDNRTDKVKKVKFSKAEMFAVIEDLNSELNQVVGCYEQLGWCSCLYDVSENIICISNN